MSAFSKKTYKLHAESKGHFKKKLLISKIFLKTILTCSLTLCQIQVFIETNLCLWKVPFWMNQHFP